MGVIEWSAKMFGLMIALVCVLMVFFAFIVAIVKHNKPKTSRFGKLMTVTLFVSAGVADLAILTDGFRFDTLPNGIRQILFGCLVGTVTLYVLYILGCAVLTLADWIEELHHEKNTKEDKKK